MASFVDNLRRGPLLALAGLVAALFWTPTAWADVAGPVCLIDGDTLAVNGRRSHTRCVGGTRVRLLGVDAPELEQLCQDAQGRAWYCGRAAAANLLEKLLIRQGDKPHQVTAVCVGNSKDKEGALLAVCTAGGLNLNEFMVSEGWAMADRRMSEEYVAAEEAAKAARKNIWSGPFDPPWEWRKKHQK
jgi:endonuclease YncB( thermonuclease family)